MEYTVDKLAKLSGISARAIRYYDEIGLLRPARISDAGYRLYGPAQVDRLQQILFYRAMGLGLAEIGRMLSSPGFDRVKALEGHLASLLEEKDRIEGLIGSVQKTLGAWKGENTMKDEEKFESFRGRLLEENESKYGGELREAYGEETMEQANAKLRGMKEETWQKAEALRQKIGETLRCAMRQGGPAGKEAQKACRLHREWICLFWPDGTYSKEAHRGLGEMYTADERFRAYYEETVGAGAADFLRNALRVFTA